MLLTHISFIVLVNIEHFLSCVHVNFPLFGFFYDKNYIIITPHYPDTLIVTCVNPPILMTPWDLIQCPNFCSGPSNSIIEKQMVDQSLVFSWLIHLQCQSCTTSWSVCHQCNNVRHHFRTPKQIRSHNHRVHHERVKSRKSPPSRIGARKRSKTSPVDSNKKSIVNNNDASKSSKTFDQDVILVPEHYSPFPGRRDTNIPTCKDTHVEADNISASTISGSDAIESVCSVMEYNNSYSDTGNDCNLKDTGNDCNLKNTGNDCNLKNNEISNKTTSLTSLPFFEPFASVPMQRTKPIQQSTNLLPQVNNVPELQKVILPKYSRQQSTDFFQFAADIGDANIPSFLSLVTKCHFHLDLQDEESCHRIHHGDAKLYIYLAYLMNVLTKNQRDMVQHLLVLYDRSTQGSTEEYVNMCNGTSTKQKRILTLPLSQQQVRREYMEGKYAVYSNLPHPLIRQKDDHSYCLPSDWIRHLLSFSNEVPFTKKKDHVVSEMKPYPLFHIYDTCNFSKLTKLEGIHQEYHQFYLSEWSDEFEPNYSLHNKGSVWAKTLSLYMPPGYTDSPEYTFLLALGRKSATHRKVEEVISDDLKMLCSPSGCRFYSKQKRKIITMHCSLLCSIQDQPARREYTGVGGGNGTYTARWGVSFNWNGVVKVLPSCNTCKNLILDYISGYIKMDDNLMPQLQQCRICCNWGLSLEHPLLQVPVSSEYPKSDHLEGDATTRDSNGDLFLVPFRIQFSTLKNICLHTHNCIVNKKWTTKSAHEYLRCHSLNEVSIQKVILHAENALLYSTLSNCVTSTNTESIQETNHLNVVYEETMEKYEKYPELYRPWSPPSSWNSELGMSLYTNAPMHLFSGITKTTFKEIEIRASQVHSGTKYHDVEGVSIEFTTKATDTEVAVRFVATCEW